MNNCSVNKMCKNQNISMTMVDSSYNANPQIYYYQNIDNQLDDNYLFPFLNTWQDCYNQLCYLAKNSLSSLQSETVCKNIMSLIKILVNFGNVREDVVLKSAMCYYFIKHTNLQINFPLSQVINQNINCLINANKDNNYDIVFFNKNAYLNKIILAEILLNNSQQNMIEQTKNQQLAKLIIGKYSNIIKNNLMKQLIKVTYI